MNDRKMEKPVLFALVSMLFAGCTSVIAKLGLEGISGELGLTIRTVFVFGRVMIFAAFSVSRSELSLLTPKNLESLRVNQTTKDEARQLLGPPYGVTRMPRQQYDAWEYWMTLDGTPYRLWLSFSDDAVLRGRRTSEVGGLGGARHRRQHRLDVREASVLPEIVEARRVGSEQSFGETDNVDDRRASHGARFNGGRGGRHPAGLSRRGAVPARGWTPASRADGPRSPRSRVRCRAAG